MLKIEEWLKIAGLLNEAEEEDEDLFGEEGDTEEETAEDNTEDEGEDEEESEADDDEEEKEDEEDKSEDKEEDPPEPTDVETFDAELDAMLSSFETNAITQTESNSLAKTLLEQEKRFDVVKFTDEVARVIKNFTSLVDYEKMVINKAKSFLIDKHSEEVADIFADMLDDRHGISLEPKEPDQPAYAQGAMSAE